MIVNDCDDNVRFALSDDTGDLHFTAFDIVNAPECAGLVEELREKLLGRSLAQIDVAEIQRISCHGKGQCMQTIVRTITECQDMFLQRRR
jgi:hypothetical protein